MNGTLDAGKVQKQWDRADIWFMLAAVGFVAALGIEAYFPEEIWAKGLHFVADAALVGGIADWFAVTAIFEHPFGIHIPNTAILPNKRKDFAEGAANFVKGLLSEEVVVNEIRGMDVLDGISSTLKNADNQKQVIEYLLDLVRDKLDAVSHGESIEELSDAIRQKLLDYSTKDLIRQGTHYLQEKDNGRRILELVAPRLKKEVGSSEFRDMLKDGYQNARQENVTGFKSLLTSIGELAGVVSYDDAAELTQLQLLEFAGELGVRNSEAQQRVLCLLAERADEIASDRHLVRSLDAFKRGIIEKMPLEAALRDVFEKLLWHFREEEGRRRISEGTEKALRSHIAELLKHQFNLLLNLLRNDKELQEDLDYFLKDIATEFATDVARPRIAKITKQVLENMTDEKLNEIVRSKVREDLMFIRINGVIVGALIGGVLFAAMLTWQNMMP